MDELRRAADGLTAAELERARAQMKAGLLMGLESPSARAERLARMLSVWGRVPDIDETVAKIDAVTPERLRAFAEGAGRSAPTRRWRCSAGRGRARPRRAGEAAGGLRPGVLIFRRAHAAPIETAAADPAAAGDGRPRRLGAAAPRGRELPARLGADLVARPSDAARPSATASTGPGGRATRAGRWRCSWSAARTRG